jgi:hypothetical protein
MQRTLSQKQRRQQQPAKPGRHTDGEPRMLPRSLKRFRETEQRYAGSSLRGAEERRSNASPHY